MSTAPVNSMRSRSIAAGLLGLTLLTGGISSTRADGQRPLMRDFIGLNGHTVQFKPDLYRPLCRLVRDYHPVEWDLAKDSSVLPAFPSAKNGVKWDSVYGSWTGKGWVIDACLMFESLKRPEWKIFKTWRHSAGGAI